MGRGTTTICTLTLVAASVALGTPIEAQQPTTKMEAPDATVERVADLIRLWNFVRFFDVEPRATTTDWESALADAASPAFSASDDTQLQSVVQQMMARVDPIPPSFNAAPATPNAGPDAKVFGIRGGVAVMSCRAATEALVDHRPLTGDVQVFTSAAKRSGMIIDCRAFPWGPRTYALKQSFTSWFPSVLAPYLSHEVGRGANRLRFHDGYPPDNGASSGGYVSGVVDESLGPLVASGSAKDPPLRLVYIVDFTSPDLRSFAAGLQASGQAKVLVQGSLSDPDLYFFNSKHVRAMVKTADYIGPNGRAGFRPDACIAAAASDPTAFSVARALLARRKVHRCTPSSPERTPAPLEASHDEQIAAPAPNLGERMVALAKLWGTFEYFHPYKNLDDRPWSAELEKFVPIFAAATTRAAYEDAISRLATLSNDSHVFVMGLQTSPAGMQLSAPPIYVRPVQGTFAVGGLHDPTLARDLHLGDEIVAVDGRPLKDVAASVAPLIAASTPQALALREAEHILSGPKDSIARLTIRRGNVPPFDVTVQRSMMVYEAFRRPHSDEPSFHRIGTDIGYVDLERITPREADLAIDQLMDTKAIIFDLRGYPQGTAWVIAPRLALPGREGAVAALFRRPTYIGPGEPQEVWKSVNQRIPTTAKPPYRGKVIVLIDARAISQSEHTAMFFEAAANPIFVGTPTTGANGDVTNVSLPGGLVVSFTGHDVRHADGRQLQRVGIQPTIVVAPTLAGLQQGRDEVLEAGLAVARRP